MNLPKSKVICNDGVILICDLNGNILSVKGGQTAHDLKGIKNSPFSALFYGKSIEHALQAVVDVRNHEQIFTREMMLSQMLKTPITYYLSGFRDEEKLVFILSRAVDDMFDMYTELLQINKEQANFIRSLSKKLYQTHKGSNDELFDDLSSLNNELANTQRELSKKNHQLEKLHNEKDKMIGVLAHDLRNPISVITVYTEVLEMMVTDTKIEEEVKVLNLLDNIRNSSKFMADMVDELLDISHLSLGKLKLQLAYVEFDHFIESIIKMNNIAADYKNIDIELVAPQDLPVVEMDHNKIRQVLNNLIGNAVKFSEKGSHIKLEIIVDDGSLTIKVFDKGQGIKKEEQDNLFRAFSTTSTRSTEGEKSTGLGLNICKNIIEAHNGEIGVESEEGLGSCFWFTLPCLYAQKV